MLLPHEASSSFAITQEFTADFATDEWVKGMGVRLKPPTVVRGVMVASGTVAIRFFFSELIVMSAAHPRFMGRGLVLV
ncbi:MAG: hypothetical protein WCG77_10090 [Actinomycetes bacterium]